MIKVAIIIPSLANTGPIIVAQNIISQLQYEVDFHVFYFDDIKELQFNCPCTRINFLSPPNFDDFDIIHSHMLRPDCFVWWHKRKLQPQLITTLHQYIFQNLYYSYNKFIATLFSPIWIKLIKAFDKVVCINSHMASFYKTQLKGKTTFVYNGVNSKIDTIIDVIDLSTINNLKVKYKILGSVAQLTERKGFDQVIKTLPHLPECAYVIVGDGKEKAHLKTLAKTLQVDDRVLFLGYKPNGASYIHQFDSFIMPSRSEGFGLSLMEAVACKKPIVCSNIDSFKELLSEDEVLFFELENITSLQYSIKESININYNKNDNALQKLNSFYTDKAMAKQYLELYKTMLKTTINN
jgi:glycosyltransferase involved in cell wall biosynthesis